MTTKQELIALADEYARCNANHHVEDMYGTSKGYTAECKSFSDEARARLLQAIESLSAEVERRIGERDAAWAEKERKEVMLSKVTTERAQLRAQLEAQGEAVAYVKFKDGAVHFDTDDNIVISNTPGDCVDESIDWRPVFTHPAPAAPVVELTVDDVRNAGGIVHKDGNIFFTNIDKLNAALHPTKPKGEKA